MSGLSLIGFFTVALVLILGGLYLDNHEWKPVRKFLCSVGFHGRPIGLIDWLSPYDPRKDTIQYRNFLGCPYCRKELKL